MLTLTEMEAKTVILQEVLNETKQLLDELYKYGVVDFAQREERIFSMTESALNAIGNSSWALVAIVSIVGGFFGIAIPLISFLRTKGLSNLKKSYENLHNNVTKLMEDLKTVRTASEEVEQEVSLAKASTKLLTGFIYLNSNPPEYENALNAFQESTKYVRTSNAYCGIASVYLRMREYEKALENAYIAKELNPSSYEAYEMLAVIFARIDNYELLYSTIKMGVEKIEKDEDVEKLLSLDCVIKYVLNSEDRMNCINDIRRKRNSKRKRS